VANIEFLPGVDEEHVLDRLAKAGGNEVESRKLVSKESSAALAVNTFGWFIRRPSVFPNLPGMEPDIPASLVDVEYCARFPWRGGRHPWLDAVVETKNQLVGIESKRFEPFRGKRPSSLSDAYDRKVWGAQMGPYEAMRDALRTDPRPFEFLDGAQLVKHALGLVTDARRKNKKPLLVYLFAEPEKLGDRLLKPRVFSLHRDEIARFASAVAGAEVEFHAISYREWFKTWSTVVEGLHEHREALTERFNP
jgi:hypothetical protein